MTGGHDKGATDAHQHQPPVSSRHHNGQTDNDTTAGAPDNSEPPSKKRKLIIHHKQSTLDRFTIARTAAPLKLPTTVAVARPIEQRIETSQVVHTAIAVNNEDSSRRTSTTTQAEPPQPARQKKEEKRTLRSQDDGPRLKSELAVYFPNYEEVIFDLEEEEGFITADTSIYVTDDAPKQATSSQSSPSQVRAIPLHIRHGSSNGVDAEDGLYRTGVGPSAFNGSTVVDLDLVARTILDYAEDPLSDEHFFKSHRRAERKEKQLRNIERERAMHEKVQLERLLGGLQGHDWLKVLGITGITDGEAKKYEPKRDYFIAEVQALVDKFRQWKEQEKKQRLEQKAAAAREAESEERDTTEGSLEPLSSDSNASAARQLQRETFQTINVSRSKTTIRLNFRGNDTSSGPKSTPRPQTTLQPVSPDVPFTSFFDKRHIRDAALGKARQGRNVLAFGHPIPEMPEREFKLPREYVNEDVLRANARERRRRNRGIVADAAAP